MKFFIAKVCDNDDTDKEGKIQVCCDYIHHSFQSTEYPWAKPAPIGGGGSNSSGSSFIPETDSKVWVYFEDEENWRNPFYIFDVHLSSNHPHGLYDSNVGGTVGASSSYPDVKFWYMPNGVCIAMSAGDKEITLYHSSSTYVFIEDSGKVMIKSGDEIELDGNGSTIVIDSSEVNINNGNFTVSA